MSFLVTKNCKKIQKIDENFNIDEEGIHKSYSSSKTAAHADGLIVAGNITQLKKLRDTLGRTRPKMYILF